MNHFLRCKNAFDVPESMCTLCLQTLVAPDPEALERAEHNHKCKGARYTGSFFGKD
ncbi:MAG TPA: hypothetical protein VK976_14305 [Verrucomicrobiae bacterium]|nr:hypothetical protein [Verrucomicrobiae bacterium]